MRKKKIIKIDNIAEDITLTLHIVVPFHERIRVKLITMTLRLTVLALYALGVKDIIADVSSYPDDAEHCPCCSSEIHNIDGHKYCSCCEKWST